MSHPSGLHPRVVAKVFARRGRLHAYETLTPGTTALVVIDLTRGSVEADANCRALVPKINAVAAALRKAGGLVAWVAPAPLERPDSGAVAMVGPERAQLFHDMARPEDPRSELWPELEVLEGDLRVRKLGHSAFFPGKSDLPEQLAGRGIDTLLIAGTVTNVCCEASGRDAVELGYRVTMISDALAGHAFGLHEASLTTFYRIYGDVRPATEVLDLVRAGNRLLPSS